MDPLDPARVNNFERWETGDAIEALRQMSAAPDGVTIKDAEVRAYETLASALPSEQITGDRSMISALTTDPRESAGHDS